MSLIIEFTPPNLSTTAADMASIHQSKPRFQSVLLLLGEGRIASIVRARVIISAVHQCIVLGPTILRLAFYLSNPKPTSMCLRTREGFQSPASWGGHSRYPGQ